MTEKEKKGYNIYHILAGERGDNALDRLRLVERLLHECTQSAVAITGFLEKPRIYSKEDDEKLFMREVHFVVALGTEEQATMSEMADRLHVTRGAVTQIANRLEKKGYIVRLKASDDKRQTTVSLTEKGKILSAEHITYDQQKFLALSERLREFSDEDLAKFIRYEHLIRELFIKQS